MIFVFWAATRDAQSLFPGAPKDEQRRCLLNLEKGERQEMHDYTRGGIFIPKYHQGGLSQPSAHHSQATHLFALHTMFHPINSPRVENAVRCWGVKGEMPSFLILAPSSFYEISQTVRTRPSSFSTDGLLMMVVSRDVAVTA
jgi:hypothetical protein